MGIFSNKFCFVLISILVAVAAYILYFFTKPHYNVGDAFIYYQQHSKDIQDAILGNKHQIFDNINNFVHIQTEDGFTLYIEQCVEIEWNAIKSIEKIKPILFVNGGPGFPPKQCPLFLSLLTKQGNNDNIYYIPYIYHKRGTGKSSRLYDSNQSFSTWNEKSNAFEHLHKNMGIYQHILDIERIREYLMQFYQTKIAENNKPIKISLIGHSFGAIFSTLYTAEFPQNVETLILIAGAPLLDFNVLYAPKYDIFSMVRGYLSDEIIDEYDQWVSQYTNFYGLIELNETEINKVSMRFFKYYTIANRKQLQLKYASYGSNICEEEEKIDYDYIDNIGGWMTIAIYYDMGMWHYWKNKVNQNICKYNKRITSLILHCQYDLQTVNASMEFLDLFQCDDGIRNAEILSDILPKSDHTIVYNDNAQCVTDLADKIVSAFNKK